MIAKYIINNENFTFIQDMSGVSVGDEFFSMVVKIDNKVAVLLENGTIAHLRKYHWLNIGDIVLVSASGCHSGIPIVEVDATVHVGDESLRVKFDELYRQFIKSEKSIA